MSRRSWKVVAGYALAIAALVYVVRHIGVNGAAFAQSLADLSPICVVLALAAFGVHTYLNALGFAALSQACGVRLRTGVLSSAWASSLLAKYVPGGVWQVVGRGMLLKSLGVPVRITVITGAIEQAISLAACAALAAAAYLVISAESIYVFFLLVVACVSAVWIGMRVSRVFVPLIDARRFTWAIGTYTLALVPYAVGYVTLVVPEHPADFLYALFGATVAGVLAIPVPGGLGVREGSAVLLLSSPNSGQVMAGMLVARLLLLICDVAGTVIGLRITTTRSSTGSRL